MSVEKAENGCALARPIANKYNIPWALSSVPFLFLSTLIIFLSSCLLFPFPSFRLHVFPCSYLSIILSFYRYVFPSFYLPVFASSVSSVSEHQQIRLWIPALVSLLDSHRVGAVPEPKQKRHFGQDDDPIHRFRNWNRKPSAIGIFIVCEVIFTRRRGIYCRRLPVPVTETVDSDAHPDNLNKIYPPYIHHLGVEDGLYASTW